MKRNDLVKAIKATRGKILAAIPNRDHYIYVAVEKADLVKELESSFDSQDITGFHLSEKNGQIYFDRDYEDR
jgi:hypothetical protein